MVLSSFMGGSNMSKVLNNLLGVLSLPSTRFTSAKQGRHFLQNLSSTGQQAFVYSISLHPNYGWLCSRPKSQKQGCFRELQGICLKSFLHPKDLLSFKMLIQGVTPVWLRAFGFMPELLCYPRWHETLVPLPGSLQTERFRLQIHFYF